MSEYIKHTWANGEEIDADKLNNMETGITEAKIAAEQSALSAEKAKKAADKHASRHAATGDDPITPTMIGAAPSGYGLGEVLKEVEHADSCMLTGIYRVKSGHPFDYGIATIFVTGDSSSILTQIAFGINLNPTNRNAIAVRNYSGAFEEWEWINPPMKTDVEYRTTERYNGNPVYTMLVDFGTLPSNNYRDEEFTDVSITAIRIECVGNYTGEHTYADLAAVGFVDSVQVMNRKIRITTNVDSASKWSAVVRVWYTKN